MTNLINFIGIIMSLIGFVIFPIVILIQIFLSIFLMIRKVNIYNKYKEMINKYILKDKNAGVFNFLIHSKFKNLVYKSFSRRKYESAFKEIFKFNKLYDRGLKQELEDYIKISRIQMMLGILLVIFLAVFFIVFFVWIRVIS